MQPNGPVDIVPSKTLDELCAEVEYWRKEYPELEDRFNKLARGYKRMAGRYLEMREISERIVERNRHNEDKIQIFNSAMGLALELLKARDGESESADERIEYLEKTLENFNIDIPPVGAVPPKKTAKHRPEVA